MEKKLEKVVWFLNRFTTQTKLSLPVHKNDRLELKFLGITS
jgi:hypothetical protein